MGIKHLNKFLMDNCSKNAIRKINLSELSGKTLVIDTSIYLYRFIADNLLIENLYLFISILKINKITPIFIFDGKPPQEKNELLKMRNDKKKEAEQKYNELMFTINDSKINTDDKKKITEELDSLKSQFIRVKEYHIKQVKELMDSYGVLYYDAPNEADELCALFMKSGKAWGCISDDMDMFIYDSPYIIRSVSLMNQTALLYDRNMVLGELNLSDKLFREIMILSGTDYNIKSKTSLIETIKWFYEYNEYISNSNNKPIEFYIWLIKNTKYIEDYYSLLKTYKMFILENSMLDIDISFQKNIDTNKLKNIMKKEGFIFL